MKIPLILKLLIPLVIGVVFNFYIPFVINSFWVVLLVVILVLLVLPFFINKNVFRAFFGLVSFLFFCVLGMYLSQLQNQRNNSFYFFEKSQKQLGVFQFQLSEQPEEKENSVKCKVDVVAFETEKTIGKTLVYFEKNTEAIKLNYGDLLVAKTNFNPVHANGNPKEFDYARYLKLHGIFHQAYVKAENWERVGTKDNFFYAWIYRLRSFLNKTLEKSGLNESNLMVAKALVLGDKDNLDRETLRSYSSAGAMHVLAVSGLHVGIIMLLFSALFKPVKKLPRGQFWFVFLVICAIWFYACITGFSSSVLRAAVMFSFVLIGKEIERDNSVFQSIFVSAFLMILIEPLIVFQVGFQLSYLAVIGIVFLQPKLYQLLYSRYFVLDKVWQITSVSIAAQIATFPLGLYYFHQFPNFFLLSNLIVIPLAFFILISGIVYLLTAWIPYLERILFYLFEFLLSSLNWGVKWVESLPYSIYWGVSIRWFEVFLLYFIIVTVTVALVKKKKVFVKISLIAILGLLIFNVAEKQKLDSENTLVIYNVNKASAIDFFYGQKNIFVADEALLNDEDKLLFHVKHNWFYRMGNEKANLTYSMHDIGKIVKVGEEELFIYDKEAKDSIPKTNLVYVQNIYDIPPNIISDWKNRRVSVVLGGEVGDQLKKILVKELPVNQLHVLKQDGAFTYSFNRN